MHGSQFSASLCRGISTLTARAKSSRRVVMVGAASRRLWWRDPADIEAVRNGYTPHVSGLEPTEVFVVEYDGIPILIQRFRVEDYPEWGRNAE